MTFIPIYVVLVLTLLVIVRCTRFRVPQSMLSFQKAPRQNATNDAANVFLQAHASNKPLWSELWKNYKALNSAGIVPKPEEKMHEFVKRCKPLAKSNNTEAQFSLGMCYLCGFGLPMNMKRSFRYIRLAAKQGHAEAQMQLGHMLIDIDQQEEATVWLGKAFEKGRYNDLSVMVMGVAYDSGQFGMEQNHSKALECFKLSKSPIPLCHVAEWYRTGTHLSQNDTCAFELMNISASMGWTPAELSLAGYLVFGVGCTQNTTEALRRYDQCLKRSLTSSMHGLILKYDPDVKSVLGAVQYALGTCFRDGNGVKRNLKKAREFFTRAAVDNDNASAQYELALHCLRDKRDIAKTLEWFVKANSSSEMEYEQRGGVVELALARAIVDGNLTAPDDDDMSYKLFWAACKRGNLAALYDLGDMYRQKGDISNCLYVWKGAAGLNSSSAILGLIHLYIKGVPKAGFAKNMTEAFRWIKVAADNEIGCGFMMLGACYLDGTVVTRNITKAVEAFTMAIQHGEASAGCYHLGKLYLEGAGAELAANETRAFELFHQGADMGDTNAMIWLAECYNTGTGTPHNEPDIPTACRWIRAAADAGNARAQNYLGDQYLSGQGFVAANAEEGFRWYTKACNQGDAEGQYNVGMCYLHGVGVGVSTNNCTNAAERNVTIARRYFELAAAQNFTLAVEELANLTKTL